MRKIITLLNNIKYMSYRRYIINSHLNNYFLPLSNDKLPVYDLGGKKFKKTYFLNKKNLFEESTLKVINNDKNENSDILGDAHNIPLEDNSVSSLIFIETIQYLENPKKSLEEISRVLKFGGKAAISFPLMYNELEDHTDRYRFTFKFINEYFSNFKFRKILNCGGIFGSIGQFAQSKSYDSNGLKRIILYYFSIICFIFDIFINNYKGKNSFTNGYIILIEK